MTDSPCPLSSRQLNRATLARQMLLAREEISAVAAVERLIGMQAQEARPPFVGLWSRLHGFQRDELHQALQVRTVVRGTMMRGTLHLLSARDYATFRTTIQPVLDQAMKALGDRAAGLELEQVLPVARELLRERPRTFSEMRGLLQERFPEVNERALGFTVRMQIPLVMAPVAHRWSFPANAEFALAEAWLGAPVSPEVAVAELLRRYLAAFGPASLADAQTWSGLPAALLKLALATLRSACPLLTFQDERGRELLDLPEAPRPDPETPAPVRFLPEFDNLLLSHADRTRVIANEHRNVVYKKGNLRLLATILVEGEVRGTWRVERKRREAVLQITPFAPLPKQTKAALEQEGEALLQFLEDDAAIRGVTFAT